MLVKAKWNVKDADGWHKTGEVWDAREDLGECVERLEAPVTETVPEVSKAEQKPRSTSRRKTSK